MTICPLHQTPYPCRCTRSDVTPVDLAEPAAIGLWECASGHRNVGPPTVSNQGGTATGPGVCPCGLRAVRIGATVIPSRL